MMKLQKLGHRSFSSLSEVRVRFAPSPTGFVHLGGLRTALINFLFARKHRGKFILRIEDTDQTRIVPGALESLQRELEWANLTPDEGPFVGGPRGPYIQSERLKLYQQNVVNLLDSGKVYRCFCSSLRLDLLRKEAIKNRETPKYDNRCRHLSTKEIESKLKENKPYTLRLKLQGGNFAFQDLIHGSLSMDVDEGDPILLKSDGFPTYHLANVVDDHLMGITHVLRGSEWQLSTPKHYLLYHAFGWEPPLFGHLPLIINTEGEKLSKRNDDIRVENLRMKGIYPQVLLSYINSMNKYTHPSNVIWSLDELIQTFSLDNIGTSASRLSITLMNDVNAQYIKYLIENDPKTITKSVRSLIKEKLKVDEDFSEEIIIKALKWSLSESRLHYLPELVDRYAFIWKVPEYSWSVKQLDSSLGPLQNILSWSAQIARNSDTTDLMMRLKDYCQSDNINYAKYMKLLRLSLTNLQVGPPVGEILEILGKDRFCDYLDAAARYVEVTEKSLLDSIND